MRALAKEIAAALAFITIGVLISGLVLLVHEVEASPSGDSDIWRGMLPFDGQQCYDWEHDPDPYWRQFHIDGWQSCWHLTEPGYPAIDYNRGAQTAGSQVRLFFTEYQYFKFLEYTGICKGVRAGLYWGNPSIEENYSGDIHYLHIDVYAGVVGTITTGPWYFIGTVASEENPGCTWTGAHLHQSADASPSFPFYSNRFVDPSQGDNWQHVIVWGGEDDSDGDGFVDWVEVYLGTDRTDDCPDVVGSHDAWPLDINMDTYITAGGDVLNFRGHIGATPGTAEWSQRLDLNADGAITIGGDTILYRGRLGDHCY